MCGPIVVGLNLGGTLKDGDETAGPKSGRLRSAVVNLFLYQCGRSITYAGQGALAGWGGRLLQDVVQDVTRITGLLMAAVLVFTGVMSLFGRESLGRLLDWGLNGRTLGPLVRWARQLSSRRQKLVLGVILGFLPCMIPLWALGLAATTQSPLHGALIMVLLVWMTSFVIFGFGLAPALFRSRGLTFQRRLMPALLLLSGIWLGLVSAGANGWIDHLSIGFTFGGKGYTIMLW
jgi:sulfite exporter TauE/SafE